jgi:hypothetical protein
MSGKLFHGFKTPDSKTISKAIVFDSSMRFSGKTFIRMMTGIIRIGNANGLPASKKMISV